MSKGEGEKRDASFSVRGGIVEREGNRVLYERFNTLSPFHFANYGFSFPSFTFRFAKYSKPANYIFSSL